MSNVAYVRVSTEEQNEARQKEALARELGISRPTLDRLFSEYENKSVPT